MADLDRVLSLEQLLRAYENVRRGKSSLQSTLKFDYYREAHIGRLQYELATARYRSNPYSYFVVTDPKRRQIAAPNFRDRILHHALVAVIEPHFERRFIYDSYACRKGKGTHLGLARIKHFLMAARSVHGATTPLYFLKCDIRTYFQSISWDVLLAILERTLTDKSTLSLMSALITQHKVCVEQGKLRSLPLSVVNPHTRTGIPIGNLTSQLFANVYLNELDQFVKHTLRERWYGRYMDDFLIIHPDKEHLKAVRDAIGTFLQAELKLTLHPNKVYIQNTSFGISFVGYRIFHDHVLVRGKTLRRFQKRFTRRSHLVHEGRLDPYHLDASLTSFLGHLKHANAHQLSELLRAKRCAVCVPTRLPDIGQNKGLPRCLHPVS